MDARLNAHMDVLEEKALAPKDSLTRLYALEEARGLDYEVKRHEQLKGQGYRLRNRVCSKGLHSPSQIYRPCSK